MPETNSDCDDVPLVRSSSEHRKSTKPIMEKRRRARINASLSELKTLLLDVMKKEGSRHHKMEKADILEMTVKHLRQIQRQQFTVALADDPAILDKYQSGFSECANEVSRYLDSLDGLSSEVRARLLTHLNTCMSGVASRTTQRAAPISPQSPQQAAKGTIPDINNNTLPNLQTLQGLSMLSNKGLQILPGGLPGNNVAFVIPGNMLNVNGQGYIIPVYTGLQNTKEEPNSPTSPQPLVVIPRTTSPSSTASSPRPCSASGSMSPASQPCTSPSSHCISPSSQRITPSSHCISPASTAHDLSLDHDTCHLSPHKTAFTPVRPQPYTTRPEHRHRGSPILHPNPVPAHQHHPKPLLQSFMPQPLDISQKPALYNFPHKDDMWRPW